MSALVLTLIAIASPAGAGRLILEMDPALAPGRRAVVLSALSRSGDGTSAVTIAPMFAGHTGTGDPLSRFYIAETVDEDAADRFLFAAAREPGVIGAVRDVVLPLSGFVPDDPYFNHAVPDSQQWPLHANPAGPDLDIMEAWSVTRGDTSIVLAVLDSGVEWRHPDFGPSPSPEGTIWTNWAEAAGLPGVDDDNNGFVDDVRGWDFVDVTTIAGESARVDTLEDGFDPDNDPSDFDGHGTVVAGIIGARADDGVGMAGAAPGCRVMPLRVGWHEDYVNNLGRRITGGVVAMSFCAQAIVYAVDNGARVLNCSWLSDPLPALATALDYAIIDRGVVVVDAAGNGGLSETQSRNYLSRRGDCIEVAALRSNGGISAVTSLGAWVDIAAPGERLLTLLPLRRSARYAITTVGATSFAAPFVTAVAGLALSIDPTLTPPEVRQLLMETATNIDAVNPSREGKYGAGLVSAAGIAARLTGRGRFRLPQPPSASPTVLGDGRFLALDAAANLVTLSPDGSAADSTQLLWSSSVAGEPAASGAPGGVVRAVSFRSGHVLVTDEIGRPLPGWPRPIGGFLFAGPVLADLDNDDRPEVLQAGTDSLLYAWDLEGRRIGGFPVRLSGACATGVAAGDLDGDGDREIAVATLDGAVHLFDRTGAPLPGWPSAPREGVGRQAPLLCDLNGDARLDIVIAGGAVIHAFDRFGTVRTGWPVTLPSPPAFELAAAALDLDGRAALIVAESGGRIHVLNESGQPRGGWPVDAGAPLVSGPIAVSVDGGARPAVIAVSGDACVNAWDGNGAVVSGWPFGLDGPAAYPAAGGFDMAGNAAVWIYGGDRVVRRLPLPDAPTLSRSGFWFGYGGHPGRDRALPLSPIAGNALSAKARGNLLSVTPNPSASGRSVFRFRMENSSPGALVLFDVQGRPVRRLFEGVLAAGETSVEWDGTDDLGRSLPSGLYNYRLSWSGGRASGRLIRLK